MALASLWWRPQRLSVRRYLELLRELTIAHLKVKDQSAMFGLLWSVLNPLLMLTVMYFFFRVRAGRGIEHYAIYLLIGIVHYTHFANGTSASMSVLESRRNLVQSAVFPKEILVLSMVLSRTLELVVSLTLYSVFAAISGVALGPRLLTLLVLLPIQVLLVTSTSLLLASSYSVVRDTRHVWGVLLRLLLFATPIFYAPSFLGDGWVRRLAELNPIAQIIDLARRAVLGGAPPTGSELGLLLVLHACLALLLLGAFRRLEPTLVESL